MGFFDKKPKKDSGLLGNKYESDAWRKHIPCSETHDSHIGIGMHQIKTVMVIVMAA